MTREYRRPSSSLWGRIVALSLVAALSACTATQPDAIAKENRIRATGAVSTLPIAADTPTVDVQPGGNRPRAIRWADAAVTPDGRSLIVRFESGGSGCDWLDHVEVAETGDRVSVSVYLSENPEFDNVGDGPLTACAAPPTYDAAEVRLERPLRGRTVVDGGASDVARPVDALGDG